MGEIGLPKKLFRVWPTVSFWQIRTLFVGFHLDFERTLKTGGMIKAGNGMRLQPVQNSQNCLCLIVNVPLWERWENSQWENHQLSLSVCPRMKKIPHGLVWGEEWGQGCCCLSHPSPCHPVARSRHTVTLPRLWGTYWVLLLMLSGF